MISAYRTGFVAGSNFDHPARETNLVALAQAALAERRRLGVAHCEPGEEFIRGFVDGYKSPSSVTDGLQLFVARSHQ